MMLDVECLFTSKKKDKRWAVTWKENESSVRHLILFEVTQSRTYFLNVLDELKGLSITTKGKERGNPL